MSNTFEFQVFLHREMSNSNSPCQLFFVISLDNVINIEIDINEVYTYLANIIEILQSTFTIQSCTVDDFDGDVVDNLLYR